MAEPKEWKFEDIEEGYKTEPFGFVFSEKDVELFVNLSSDMNPIHTDDAYAKSKGFEGRLVHGMLIASKFSYLVGMVLPGKNCLYVSQTLNFHKPILIGEECNVVGTVVRKSESTRLVEIKTEIFNSKNERAVTGIAFVKII
jgi:3-hydroxybutyryl-CoA dehydratase